MRIIRNIFQTSLGKKYIMAGTGLVLFLFVIAHMAGNLQIFLGQEAINRYGNFLQTTPEILWPARVVLLLMILLHIWSATKLTLENRAARPTAYAQYRPVGSTYASRTMFMSGIIVFLFVVYHLLHYTVQVPAVNLTGHDFEAFIDPQTGAHDIFRMMVVGFHNPLVSAFYLLGVGLLCLHLSHGASSMFQSLGWNNDAYRPWLNGLARAAAVLIFLGYASIPIAVLLGYGKKVLP
jgi:succinate dehydrogenase / fumarate reductase, cytochrome b subunit